MVGPVEIDGKVQMLVDWRTPHDPLNPEHGIGLAFEFGMPGAVEPAGYDQSVHFLKLGVGICRKESLTMPYNFSFPYPVVDPGKWAVNQSDETELTITHRIHFQGWAYSYEKKLSLRGNELRIAHSLENTGEKPLYSWAYSHNLFQIMNRTVGPGYSFRLPFQIGATDFANNCVGNPAQVLIPDSLQPAASSPANNFTFSRNLMETDVLYCDFTAALTAQQGALHGASSHKFSVSDDNYGGMSKEGTEKVESYHFYATDSVLAVEPFMRIAIQPKHRQVWNHRIKFHRNDEQR
eukprot:CAMPEP_0185272324 /NCGR_PEP_ID=MMETSP1359-20130426/46927_1 /TAXON_ID=552665 /ORGANISM="Bigelowiella longifila, Strain CCMP242" /LENGTH=292 /DNA_ID=CAMNT_0027864569 /DNA_START=80 /DNA_END=961 /DNA_ORIENTATION=-